MGNVGFHLAKQLVDSGAKVYVSDIHQDHVVRAVENLGVVAVPADKIHTLDVDVFSPCAMGGAINDQTLPALRRGSLRERRTISSLRRSTALRFMAEACSMYLITR